VSVESSPETNVKLIEETRRQINRLFEEVGHLSESDLPPADYYGEFLKRVLQGLAAPAGAVWVRTPQGHLQLQHQINLRQVGLDQESIRQHHDELLRQAFQQARPLHIPPHSSVGNAQEGKAVPGNPTDYEILLVPVVVEQVVAGLVEVWQDPKRNPNAIPGFLQYLGRMAHLASIYIRNRQLRQITGQQQLWTQLEAFARQIHGSLNPTEVGYMIVNEGRRLIECDRVSIGIRAGKKTKVEAISGADVVEKRSNLVQLMKALMDSVIVWGEKLVYSGTKDDSLPPDVLTALDNYLAESNSKFLALLPLKDERESESKKPPRSALMMECFEPSSSTEQLIARLEVVGKHSTSAIYNAVEHKRIPLRFLWRPLAKLQEGLGGKARAIGYSILAALVILIAVMVFVPYPLKMDAKGQLLPLDRHHIFSPVEGTIVGWGNGIEPGADVDKDTPLIKMYDVQLEMKILDMQQKIEAGEKAMASLRKQRDQSGQSATDKARIASEMARTKVEVDATSKQLLAYQERTHSDKDRPGEFWLLSPQRGTVLSWGFKETLTNTYVKPSQPLLRIGDKKDVWEVELKIPQKHIGQILQAYKTSNPEAELDVDILLSSRPTEVFKGKLARGKIGGEAAPTKDDPNESEPMILASVRIDGKGIAKEDRIRPELLTTGTEVHTKVRCGTRAMGYSLFYGLWEFFYEKVVFFF
jgi:hypothetical protein